MKPRLSQIKRHTRETQISLRLNLDGKGKAKIRTGIPFFDHMLTLFAKHATVDLELRCHGDLEVEAHHTVEDCGIALGQAFAGVACVGQGFCWRDHDRDGNPGLNGPSARVKVIEQNELLVQLRVFIGHARRLLEEDLRDDGEEFCRITGAVVAEQGLLLQSDHPFQVSELGGQHP